MTTGNETTVDEITLKSMRFHARVGILPHERESAQPIEIDLRVHIVPGAEVVDYRALYALTADIVNSGHIDFLEEIGERIASAALFHNGRIRAARVAVRKPHVSLGGPLDYAEVVVDRAASNTSERT